MPKARRRDEVARLEAELEAARPFLRAGPGDLRRRGPAGGRRRHLGGRCSRRPSPPSPQRERLEVVRAVFDRLAPDQQWAVLERPSATRRSGTPWPTSGTPVRDEVRPHGRPPPAGRHGPGRAPARRRRSVPEGELLTLGLFREADVSPRCAGGVRGRETAARRLVLRRVEGHGTFAVVEDVFNPDGGYFVNAEYDRDAGSGERLPRPRRPWPPVDSRSPVRLRAGALRRRPGRRGGGFRGPRGPLAPRLCDGRRRGRVRRRGPNVTVLIVVGVAVLVLLLFVAAQPPLHRAGRGRPRHQAPRQAHRGRPARRPQRRGRLPGRPADAGPALQAVAALRGRALPVGAGAARPHRPRHRPGRRGAAHRAPSRRSTSPSSAASPTSAPSWPTAASGACSARSCPRARRRRSTPSASWSSPATGSSAR